MNTTAIYIKTEQKTKKQAQIVASKLGLSLSSVINGFLKQFIRTKTVTFSVQDEIPNEHTLALMKKAEKDYEKGNTSPSFKTGEEAIAWLEK